MIHKFLCLLLRYVTYSVFWIGIILIFPVRVFHSLKDEFLCSFYEFKSLKQKIEDKEKELDDDY